MLSKEQLIQYSRQIVLPGFGVDTQQKLLDAKVLIIGCGGLGCPVALYLAGVGVGHIGILDADKVSLSNLHRQIAYSNNDVGRPKVDVLSKNIQNINNCLKVSTHQHFLTTENALNFIKDYDIVIDCTDNFPTRYLVNDACEILDKPYVFAAVHQMEGQVAVFNVKNSATYRDLFPEPPPMHLAPDCSVGGVLGALVGIVGSFQALECIKVITGYGKPLINKMLVFDASENYYKTLSIKRQENRENVTHLIDYDKFCSFDSKNGLKIEKFKALDFTKWVLIDVRTEEERAIFDIGGIHIPMPDLDKYSFDANKSYVFYCQSGKRSKAMVEKLTALYEHINFDYLAENLDTFH